MERRTTTPVVVAGRTELSALDAASSAGDATESDSFDGAARPSAAALIGHAVVIQNPRD